VSEAAKTKDIFVPVARNKNVHLEVSANTARRILIDHSAISFKKDSGEEVALLHLDLNERDLKNASAFEYCKMKEFECECGNPVRHIYLLSFHSCRDTK
jgi:hypothetical protein